MSVCIIISYAGWSTESYTDDMLKFVLSFLVAVVTSFYLFPFEFAILPGVNTKMAMAGLGLVVAGISIARKRSAGLDMDFVVIILLAVGISMASLLTIAWNGTNDKSFISYYISVLVWLSAAYVVCHVISLVHGKVTVELVCNYLILVCCIQCILALIMDYYPPLRMAVDSMLGGTEAYMGKAEGRMYGIGCALDVAGLKFSAVLVMIAWLCVNGSEQVQKYIVLYALAFIIITVIGNMISRTTTMGDVLAIGYWVLCGLRTGRRNNVYRWNFLQTFGIMALIFLPAIIVLYNTNYSFYTNIRFAFEGFFSLFETGRWQTTSNDILFNHMIVFPDNFTTWLIGDGYAANPEYDQYYIGESYHGFYKGTDIGYLRYIFYFGLLGLGLFIAYFCKVAGVCMKRFPLYRMMFLMVLAVNFIGWIKVSTDLFVVFALFLCIPQEGVEENNGIPDNEIE